jgi:hypothetical protein
MRSSQALAQSVFANLRVLNRLDVLAGLQAEDGGVAFFEIAPPADQIGLEHQVTYLGEKTRAQTSVDFFVEGDHRVAVECKFSESEIGRCSRPRLHTHDLRYCDGNYVRQGNRRVERCSLAADRILYWQHIPALFPSWRNDTDHRPCPLDKTYQLVRNILAACVRHDRVDAKSGHALLIYDRRNPAFQDVGPGGKVYRFVRNNLSHPGLVRRCSWQRIVRALRRDPELDWLTDALESKYGLTAES